MRHRLMVLVAVGLVVGSVWAPPAVAQDAVQSCFTSYEDGADRFLAVATTTRFQPARIEIMSPLVNGASSFSIALFERDANGTWVATTQFASGGVDDAIGEYILQNPTAADGTPLSVDDLFPNGSTYVFDGEPGPACDLIGSASPSDASEDGGGAFPWWVAVVPGLAALGGFGLWMRSQRSGGRGSPLSEDAERAIDDGAGKYTQVVFGEVREHLPPLTGTVEPPSGDVFEVRDQVESTPETVDRPTPDPVTLDDVPDFRSMPDPPASDDAASSVEPPGDPEEVM